MNNEYIAIFFIYFSEKFEFVFLLLKPGLDGFFCTLNPLSTALLLDKLEENMVKSSWF